MDSLLQRARIEGVWPSSRVHKISQNNPENQQENNIAIKRCADTIMSTFHPTSVATQITDDLFPASQGISESAPMSICLRFAIEYSKLRIIQIISENHRPVVEEIRSQDAVVLKWKRRCETQLQLLGMCRANRVFEMIPSEDAVQAGKIKCPFIITTSYSLMQYYITPGCLVYIKDVESPQGLQGAFFNPCRHPTKPCDGTSQYTLQEILSEASSTQLSFDARYIINLGPLVKQLLKIQPYIIIFLAPPPLFQIL